MSKDELHVVHRKDKGDWAIRKAHSKRVSGTFDTQAEAKDVAIDRAKAQGETEVFIHRKKDGKIRERNTYGKDPRRSKG